MRKRPKMWQGLLLALGLRYISTCLKVQHLRPEFRCDVSSLFLCKSPYSVVMIRFNEVLISAQSLLLVFESARTIAIGPYGRLARTLAGR